MKKDWLKQFAIDHKMDKLSTDLKVEHEKRSLEKEPGMISGWELTGYTFYNVKDKDSEYEIRVRRVKSWISQ